VLVLAEEALPAARFGPARTAADAVLPSGRWWADPKTGPADSSRLPASIEASKRLFTDLVLMGPLRWAGGKGTEDYQEISQNYEIFAQRWLIVTAASPQRQRLEGAAPVGATPSRG
jgi:hypothetical protein